MGNTTLEHLRDVEGGILWYLQHARAKLASLSISKDDEYDHVLTTIAQTEVEAYVKAITVVRKKIAAIREG